MEKHIFKFLKMQLFLIAIMYTFKASAQGKGIDIDVDLDGKDTPQIFEKPEFWIGVAVVVIIAAFILRKK